MIDPLRVRASNNNILYSFFSAWHTYDDCYVGDQEFIKEETKLYPINRDYKPVCEYYLGLKVREYLMK